MKQSMYSIKDLENLSGIKAHTIRIWEKRYHLLKPGRTNTNIRLYCEEDLKKILNVAILVKHGCRISKVSGWGNKQIHEEVMALEKLPQSHSNYFERLLISVVGFDEVKIGEVYKDLVNNLGFEKAISKVVFPFFEKLALYWQVGSVSTSHEHYFSNLIRSKIITRTEKLKKEHRQGPVILFFLHQNEVNELSLLFYNMVALSLGFNTIYLGRNIPLNDLKMPQLKKKAEMVFTAFTSPIKKEELDAYLVELSEIFPKKRVMVTGPQLLLNNPALPKKFKIVSSVKKFKRHSGVKN